MSGGHAESLIKNIIGDIVRECAVRGHAVSETLVAFMVKAVVLDPRNVYYSLCLDKLMEKCSPSLDTIKMQVYFDLNYTSRREFLEDIHQVMESKLSSVSREITDSRVKTREELEALYRKVVTYILLRSGVGSPADVNTVNEATAALQSVFPHTELGAFMVLLKRDKELQLKELTMTVTGIRLFNKAGKKGEQETDLDKLTLTEALPAISTSLENELKISQSLAWRYTAVLEKLTHPDCRSAERDVPMVLLKQALYNVRQHEGFLRMLLADACLCAKHAELLQAEFSSNMKLLKETVKSKAAVPTATVFPLFKALPKLWSGLQDEAELLNILNNISINLQPFIASQAKIFSEAHLDGLLESSEVKADEQRMIESSGERIDPGEMKSHNWLLPETTASFNELPLQYNGVCGYTVVTRDGLLLPGNPHIGVLKHKEKLYVFSSKDAAVKFASSPEEFIEEVAEKAKLSPELIQLLKLHQQFSCVSPYPEVSSEGLLVNPITNCESGTQTDIHPLETNMDKSYEWNEGEVRRKAIKLLSLNADLLSKATHSTQTDMSHMRRENTTQTWLPKNAVCQSKRDGKSSVPKPQTYLTGLGGQRDGHVVKTNLTRPVDD
uniref:Cilia- and flagella-associated protein 206 n=1 Tax=Labrus bergylta TaxID=56723 RepID=A0A3Q3G600_9LABR